MSKKFYMNILRILKGENQHLLSVVSNKLTKVVEQSKRKLINNRSPLQSARSCAELFKVQFI